MKTAVVVPCFNMGATLPETLESVLASTTRADEIVVVDDGSTDGETRRVLDDWSRHVRVVRTANQGLPRARNAGAAATRAEALLFLDADDLIGPDFLSRAAEVLAADQRVGFVTAWAKYFGATDLDFCPPPAHLPLQLIRNLALPTALVRRATFEQVGGYRPEMVIGYEDWQFLADLLARGWESVTIPALLLGYRVREGSMVRRITREGRAFLLERLASLTPVAFARHATEAWLLALSHAARPAPADRFAEAVDRLVEGGWREATVYGVGSGGRRCAELLRRRGVKVRRFVDSNPGVWGTVLDGVPVHSPREAITSGEGCFIVGSLTFAAEINASLDRALTESGSHAQVYAPA